MNDNHSQGILGEQAVNQIAFDTYLKYWCYPNPRDEKGSKKEICDLLILFKDTAIIISIKNYSFKGNYDQYFRSTLDKAVAQVNGAERKLFNNISPVYIKHPDTDLFQFSPEHYTNIHRLIINLNTAPLFYPGGRLTKKNNYVHILNWAAFLQLVIELDTIPDFIKYLDVREDAFKERELLMLNGEEADWDAHTATEFRKHTSSFNPSEKTYVFISGNELDLLADYYFNERQFHKEIYSTNFNMASFEFDGKWKDYLNRKNVVRKKQEDRVSYFIDEFVKNEVLYKTDKNNIEIATELLSFSRFERRILGQQFFEFYERYKNENGFFIARRYGVVNDTVIAYLLHGHTVPKDIVLKSINIAIEGYSYWEKYKSKQIILISVSNRLLDFKYGYMKDIKPFSSDHEKGIIHDLQVLNWFQNMENIHFTVKEYPDA